MVKRLKLPVTVVGLLTLCIVLAACPNTDAVKNASNAVNKYAGTLSSFQDAEIVLHNSKKVSDETHRSILKAEMIAAKAGHDLDAAIAVAAKGGDPSQYISIAQEAFDHMLQVSSADPVSQQELSLAASTAGAALKNAITLINTLRTAKPMSQNGHNPAWLWAMLLMPMMAAGSIGVLSAIQLLQIAVQLEPVAFDLIVRFATSLKGKSTEEILAMNEELFSKVEKTAQDELDKLPPTS